MEVLPLGPLFEGNQEEANPYKAMADLVITTQDDRGGQDGDEPYRCS